MPAYGRRVAFEGPAEELPWGGVPGAAGGGGLELRGGVGSSEYLLLWSVFVRLEAQRRASSSVLL